MPWIASPEPVRSAMKHPSAPKPSETSGREDEQNAFRPARWKSTPSEPDEDVEDGLDEPERDDPRELAGEQRRPRIDVSERR